MNGRLRSTIPVHKASEEPTGSIYVLPKGMEFETLLKVKADQLDNFAWAKCLQRKHFEPL